jgi:pyranose oxidase
MLCSSSKKNSRFLVLFPLLSTLMFIVPICSSFSFGLRKSNNLLHRSARSITLLASTSSDTTCDGSEEHYDVVIIGSGPAGSTYARALCGEDIPNKKKVLMVDAGQKFSEKAGEHVKNSLFFQMDHAEGKRRFAQFIASTFVPISTAKDDGVIEVQPKVVQPGLNTPTSKNWAMNLQNPEQDPYINLRGATQSNKVGGMGTHWTCSCPRPHPIMEANDLFPSDELYAFAEKLLVVNNTVYNSEIRNVIVGDNLKSYYSDKLDPNYPPQPLPLAVKRVNEQFVDWSSPATILGDLSDPTKENPYFNLKSQTICKRLIFKEKGSTGDVDHVELFNPKTGETTFVYAKKFVVACGQVASAQLLAASGYQGSDAVGKYLCTQPLYFTRVALRKDLIESAESYEQFKAVIKNWKKNNPEDPISIPRHGKGSGEIQQWIPLSKGHPWHTQIHIDNFYYGASDTLPIDDRLICGIRHFALPRQLESNYVEFSKTQKDMMGMPQATFHYEEDLSMADLISDMANDCANVAFELGTPLPSAGTMLQYLPDGSALHLHGCNRIGRSPKDSVCNENCKVWGTDNLYLGGNGCIPNGIACNPTLTSVALALRGSMDILGQDTKNTFHKLDACDGTW